MDFSSPAPGVCAPSQPRQSFLVQLWADEELHLRAEPGEDSSLMVRGKKVILGWKAGKKNSGGIIPLVGEVVI